MHKCLTRHPAKSIGVLYCVCVCVCVCVYVCVCVCVQGLGLKEVDEKTTELLTEIDLLDKRDTPASQLSGGQKRKLW